MFESRLGFLRGQVTLEVPGVPAGEFSYTGTLGHRPPVKLTEAELRDGYTATIGDRDQTGPGMRNRGAASTEIAPLFHHYLVLQLLVVSDGRPNLSRIF